MYISDKVKVAGETIRFLSKACKLEVSYYDPLSVEM